MKRALVFLLILFSAVALLEGSRIESFYDGAPSVSAPAEEKNISVSLASVDNDYDEVDDIYNQDFQNKIHDEVESLKNGNSYTLENPLLIADPYDTITDGLYVYFKTDDAVQMKYTVSVEGYSNYTQIVYENDGNNLSTEHETTLIGIIPNRKNLITITLINRYGSEQKSIRFYYDAPSKLGKYDTVRAAVTSGNSSQELANGLYTVLTNDATDNTDEIPNVAMYDNDGILRCEIPLVKYRSDRMLFDKNGMYYTCDSSHIARMDKTGYINRIYSTGRYEGHHDFIFGNDNDILMLGCDPDSYSTDDLVLDIDLNTGGVKKLIDLKDYLGGYYNIASLPKGETQIDWMHLNSLTLTDDGKLLLSSRETSTIIAFDDFYSNSRKIDYMIGSSNFWSGTGYEDLLFSRIGDFSMNAGQHNITYLSDDSLENGQYYLLMFNNNNTVSSTRPGYDWASDSNYSGTSTSASTKTEYSYFYKYLVDENKKTFTLTDSIAVPYSAYVSGIQLLGNGNVLIDSGSQITAYEYDDIGDLIQSMAFGGTKWTYRVIKYDYKGFWFKKD